MKRSLPAVAVAAVLALAGCGSPAADTAPAATSAAAPTTVAAATVPTPAPPGATVDGIPPLSGTPTDLNAQSQAGKGTGEPPTGLVTQDVVVGSGIAAAPTDSVSVRYSGTLYDGTPFDSTWSGHHRHAARWPARHGDPARPRLRLTGPRTHPRQRDPGVRGGPGRHRLTGTL